VLDSPYFEPGTALHDHIESSDGYDRKSEGQAGIFGLNDVESGSAVQSSSSRSEHNLMGKAVENNFQEITSPSSGNCIFVFLEIVSIMFHSGNYVAYFNATC
jgi:hypothetical protein